MVEVTTVTLFVPLRISNGVCSSLRRDPGVAGFRQFIHDISIPRIRKYIFTVHTILQ